MQREQYFYDRYPGIGPSTIQPQHIFLHSSNKLTLFCTFLASISSYVTNFVLKIDVFKNILLKPDLIYQVLSKWLQAVLHIASRYIIIQDSDKNEKKMLTGCAFFVRL